VKESSSNHYDREYRGPVAGLAGKIRIVVQGRSEKGEAAGWRRFIIGRP